MKQSILDVIARSEATWQSLVYKYLGFIREIATLAAQARNDMRYTIHLQISVYGAVEMIIVGASIARPHNILLAKYCDFRRKYGIIACDDHDLPCKSCGRPMAAPTISYDR